MVTAYGQPSVSITEALQCLLVVNVFYRVRKAVYGDYRKYGAEDFSAANLKLVNGQYIQQITSRTLP